MSGSAYGHSSTGFTEEQARHFYDLLREHGKLLIVGVDALHALKLLIDDAARKGGIYIEWDPRSPVRLKDYAGVMSLAAVRWGIAGTVAGIGVGMCTDSPAKWIGLLAGLGAIVGGVRGHMQVRRGWRLRSAYDEQGEVYVEVEVIG